MRCWIGRSRGSYRAPVKWVTCAIIRKLSGRYEVGGESSMSSEVTAQHLQAFADDVDLQQLEDAISRFNIFEAIGATNKELRHSNFLAYLLDPGQSHGLSDRFARALLAHPKVLLELNDGESFAHIDVRREYRYTDILIIDHMRGYVVIIENKI